MAADYGVHVGAESYPGAQRLRDFSLPLDVAGVGDRAFIPLFITRPAPSEDSGSNVGTVLDEVAYRYTGASTASAAFKLGYKLDESSTVVELTGEAAPSDIASDLTRTLSFATTNADGTFGSSGMAPVIPNNAIVGVILGVDVSGGAACDLTLRIATRDVNG